MHGIHVANKESAMELFDIFKYILNLLWMFVPACIIILTLSIHDRYKQPKIYRVQSSGWLDIKTHPLPKDIKGYLATDGKEVDYKYSVEWGPYGDVYYRKSYYTDKHTYITYWQPMPDLPNIK